MNIVHRSIFISFVLLFLLVPSPVKAEMTSVVLHHYSKTSGQPLLVIEKNSQKLHLYRYDQQLSLIKVYGCATGENKGPKRVSGDSRTPEGVYFITEVYEDSKITVFGTRAFHLDYPNAFDRADGREGNGIFIHGTNKKLIPFSSNGCIVLNDKDLEDLAPYLQIGTVPVIIVDSMAQPLAGNNVHLSQENQTFSEFLELLGISTLARESISSLDFYGIGDTAVASISYSIFDGPEIRYDYLKRVYLTPSISKNWRIVHSVHKQNTYPTLLAVYPAKFVTEPVYDPLPKDVAVMELPSSEDAWVAVTSPPPAPALPPQDSQQEDVLKFIEKWRKAWSQKDLESYMACYSPNFKSGKYDKKGWSRKKSHLNEKYQYINVTVKDITIKRTEQGAKVSFYQQYTSDKFKTSGTKHMQLVKLDGNWLIRREAM